MKTFNDMSFNFLSPFTYRLYVGSIIHHMMGVKYLRSIGYSPDDILITENSYIVSELNVDNLWIHVNGVPDLYTINDGKYWEVKKIIGKRNLSFENTQINYLNILFDSNILIFSKDKMFIESMTYKQLINTTRYKIISKNVDIQNIKPDLISKITNMHDNIVEFVYYKDFIYVIKDYLKMKNKEINNEKDFSDYINFIKDVLIKINNEVDNEKNVIDMVNKKMDDFIDFKISYDIFLNFVKNENEKNMKNFISENSENIELTDKQIHENFVEHFDILFDGWKFNKEDDMWKNMKINNKLLSENSRLTTSITIMTMSKENMIEVKELRNKFSEHFEIFSNNQSILDF